MALPCMHIRILFTGQDHQYYREVTRRWQKGETDLAIAGGESPLDVFNRQKVGLQKIQSNTEEKRILICMHGRAIRIFLCLLLNYDLSQMDSFEHRNLGLYELTFTGSMYSIDRYNDGSHLDQLTVANPRL